MRFLIIPLAVLALAACSKPEAPANEAKQSEAGVPTKGVDRSQAGKAMPYAFLFNAEEEKVALAEASGKPLLVNLWASWCAPCVKELPTLEALSSRKGAPRVIAVSEELAERASVDAFLKEHGIEALEVWRDPEMALTSKLGVQVMPTTVYYDASGREVWRYTGDLDWTGEEAAKLLSEAGAPAKG